MPYSSRTSKPENGKSFDAGTAWLPALEIMAAFHGAVVGIIGAVAGELTSDKNLVVIASIGAILCATIWARRLDAGT